MIQISEFLPDPIGSDAQGEWIEIWNSGTEAVSVAGWKLKTTSKGEFILKGTISPGEYLLLKRPQTKLTLKNDGETIYLFNAQGKLADEASFLFKAAEGQSFARLGASFVSASPTPGKENKILQANLINQNPPIGASLGGVSGSVWGGGLGLALFLALGILFVIKRNEDLRNIFFGGDQKTGREVSF